MALKASSVSQGSQNPKSFRIVHMLHAQMASSDASTYHAQMATSGNLLVVSYIAGGNVITGITSNPSNTWAATGPAATDGVQITSQMYYAGNAATSNSMTFTITQSGTLTGTTFMMYDTTGAAASPFDLDSGGQWGQQNTIVSSLTTCSSCLAPSAANEMIIGNFGQAWCTGTDVTVPSGALFDTAGYNGNSVNGPEAVDQNNGWFHYYDPNTSALSATWSETCGTTQEAAWGGRLAAFKAAQSTQVLPPTGLTAVVN
jgi:hypothetical protein